jgi:hypothetical protein
VFATTDDEFARGGFLRERVVMLSERHRRRAATALLAKPVLRENGLRSLAFLGLYHGRCARAESRLQQPLEILKVQTSPLSVGRVHLLLAILA